MDWQILFAHSLVKTCILVMGNWSATLAKFHDPIRGIGMHRALRKRGHLLLKIDDYHTSRHCQEKTEKSFGESQTRDLGKEHNQPTVFSMDG
ncbi:hypothetical protein BGW37DRAFT_417788 [Umbelopsis sp. PMI_123]|nr:hypothetical protein BGW37DRAFT_417788 [Umbelopsis sp. PMI_123]